MKFLLICLVVLTAKLARGTEGSGETEQLIQQCRALQTCPDGWVRRQGTDSCYFFLDEQKSWTEARAYCATEGGVGSDLAILTNKEEMGFAYDYITGVLASTSGKDWENTWVGLVRTGDSAWAWLDGSPITLASRAFWNRGEPNNSGSMEEDRGTMFASGLFNDRPHIRPRDKEAVLCEKKLMDLDQ